MTIIDCIEHLNLKLCDNNKNEFDKIGKTNKVVCILLFTFYSLNKRTCYKLDVDKNLSHIWFFVANNKLDAKND